MTTGMRTEPTVETRRRSKWNWLWLLVAAIIALALVGYATTPKPGKSGNSATTQSVQDGATGQQGAVGGFAEQVVPNSDQGTNGQTSRGTVNNNLPGSQPATGQGLPAAQSGNGAVDMGAGNSGIDSTQEGLGGANSASSGSQTGGNSQRGPNGQDMGNTAKP
jgi:hypothetical protein